MNERVLRRDASARSVGSAIGSSRGQFEVDACVIGLSRRILIVLVQSQSSA